MGLKCEPANLQLEVDAAVRARDAAISEWQNLIDRYRDAGGDKTSREGMEFPENHAYEYLSLVISRIVHNNPRVSIKSRKPGLQRMVAEAIEYAQNRWMVDCNYRQHLVRMAYDVQFGFGASIVTTETRPGYDERHASSAKWPKVCRISPKRFITDPLALHRSEGRFDGHKCVWDKDTLLELAEDKESGWNKKVIEALACGVGLKDGRDAGVMMQVPERNELVLWELWVPEVTLDESPGHEEGYHGTIYTFAEGQAASPTTKDEWVRKPRPFYGPRTGPYNMAGIYIVPDSPWPLAPLQAVDRQAKDVNDQARAMSKAAREYKRLVLVNAGDNKLIQDLKNQKDMYVVPVKGLDKNEIVSLEIGGITEQQIAQYNIQRDRLDRQLAMADAQRGTASGRGTATENAIAEESISARMAFMQEQFGECVRSELRAVAWYMYHDDRVVIPLGEDAAAELGMSNPMFHGGDSENPQDPKGEASFEDLELDIDVYSMERPSESSLMRKAEQTLAVVERVAPLVPQMPWVDWRQTLERIGDAIHDPAFADLVDERVAAQFAGQEPVFQREPKGEMSSNRSPQPSLRQLGSGVQARGGKGTPGLTGAAMNGAASASKPATAAKAGAVRA